MFAQSLRLAPAKVVRIIVVISLLAASASAAAAGVASAAPSPVAAYSFEEGEGETLHDSAGENDGAIEGATWTEDGRYGSALEFDGEDDLVSIADADDLDLTGAFTLEAWVRPESSDAWGTVLGKAAGSVQEENASGYGLYAKVEEGPRGSVTDTGVYAEAEASSALPTGSWSHLALTSDEETLRLYVDGELAATQAAITAGKTGAALEIGHQEILDGLVNSHFHGAIDDVRIYGQALSQEQIELDSTRTKATFSTSPPLLNQFDEDIEDYVLRCDGETPVEVEASAMAGTTVGVAGQPAEAGDFEAEVDLGFSQRFDVVVESDEGTSTYHVRCLPAEFPDEWDFERLAQPHHDHYVIAPQGSSLAVVFDEHGTPVWWYRDTESIFDAKFLSNGTFAYSVFPPGSVSYADKPFYAYHTRNLDGSVAEQVETAEGEKGMIKAVNGIVDFHELQELPSGNFLLEHYKPREEVDLSGFCAPVAAYSFDEGEGETLHDGAGEHDGTIEGATWTEEGKYGSALDFDGEDDLVSIADAEELDLTGTFTLEAWVRPESLPAARLPVLYKAGETEAGVSGYALNARADTNPNPNGRIGDSGSAAEVSGSSPLSLDTWAHLAFTSDGESMRFYLDGELIATQAVAIDAGANDGALEVGHNSIWDTYFDGRVDDVRIYDRALSQAQIAEDKAGEPFECGGEADTVVDGVVQEVTPDGELVWEWGTEGNVGLSETANHFVPFALSRSPRDTVHINAVEAMGSDAVLISMRHTDAIYKVDKESGSIVWKLGGSPTPERLTILGDPEGAHPLGGPHDVRYHEDGTVTVHDNRTDLGDAPRAVRYEIDEEAMTAKLIEQVDDPEAPKSGCCGSARRSADGSWLMSWGGRPLVTEFDSSHERTFKLQFSGPLSYRAVPVPESLIDIGDLRAGMDAMHPSPVGVYVAGEESEEEAEQPRFEAEAYPADVGGEISLSFDSVHSQAPAECENVGLRGELEAASKDLALEADYGQCVTTDGEASYPTTVETNSCSYALRTLNAGPPYSSSLDIACEEPEDTIEYHIYADQEKLENEETLCIAEIPAQEELLGVALANSGQGIGRNVTATFEVEGLAFTGCDGKPYTDGLLSGQAALYGE